jgi:hypothetical protein
MQLIIDGGREAFNGSDFSEGHGLQRYDEISSDIIDMRTGPCANAARVLGNSITYDPRIHRLCSHGSFSMSELHA